MSTMRNFKLLDIGTVKSIINKPNQTLSYKMKNFLIRSRDGTIILNISQIQIADLTVRKWTGECETVAHDFNKNQAYYIGKTSIDPFINNELSIVKEDNDYFLYNNYENIKILI